MIEVIIDMLPSALGVVISPLPIAAMILILMSDRAKSNGTAFVAGWILVVFAVGFTGLNLIGSNQDTTDHNKVALIVQLIAGILLLFLAGKNWVSRPKGTGEPKTPGWMSSLSKMRWFSAFGLAILLGGVNPKNLALILGGVGSIVEANLSATDGYVALTIFVVIASLSLAVPLLYIIFAGQSAKKLLSKLKVWLVRYNSVVMAVVLLLVGLKLTIKAIVKLYA
ncbi:MAG TPA: GAP family protein [Candidatus Saccharimonadales bacterium]|nr:GAP family protein [Candidatus Saccharimonadales bacterium]